MNHPDIDGLVQMERRNDAMAYAARYRLVKEAEGQGVDAGVRLSLSFSPLVVALARGMAWLGGLLQLWSCRLQSRYAVDNCY